MIKIKNISGLKYEILKNGYSFANFARELNSTRGGLAAIFRRASIRPEKAKKVVEILGIDFDKFFLVSECTKRTQTNNSLLGAEPERSSQGKPSSA